MANTLADLNAIRIDLGMPVLKAWKESKDKLPAAIAKLAAKKAALQKSPVDPSTNQTLVEMVNSDFAKPAKTFIPPPASGTGKTKPAAVTKPESKKAEVEGVSISTIAAELGIDPKVARAKLRRQEEVQCLEGSRWLFAQKDVAAIKALLKNDARKK